MTSGHSNLIIWMFVLEVPGFFNIFLDICFWGRKQLQQRIDTCTFSYIYLSFCMELAWLGARSGHSSQDGSDRFLEKLKSPYFRSTISRSTQFINQNQSYVIKLVKLQWNVVISPQISINLPPTSQLYQALLWEVPGWWDSTWFVHIHLRRQNILCCKLTPRGSDLRWSIFFVLVF